MVAVELPLKMLLGEWYGPTTTAHVIAVLTSKHSKQLTTAHNSSQQLTTHVASHGALCKHTLHSLMDSHNTSNSTLTSQDSLTPPTPPLSNHQ
mmetsp:Transcript_6942/g.8903  ORF Transcript_6942/g.8903 Transcript_6942/m.8903 type:complete len:93 (-) Transcript_6942:294-572(-)